MQTIPHTINTGIICIPILVKLLLFVAGENLEPIAKWGEAIRNDNLVNIFEEHKDCRKGCRSVYYRLKKYDTPPKYNL